MGPIIYGVLAVRKGPCSGQVRAGRFISASENSMNDTSSGGDMARRDSFIKS